MYFSFSIIITNFMWTHIQNCWNENVFSAYFSIEILYQKFHIIVSYFVEYTL
jgi:hypothetical protein